MKVRAGLSTVTAVLALAASLVVFGGGEGADATQGQALLAGQVNTETNGTAVQNTSASSACLPDPTAGLMVCGSYGIEGIGGHTGVFGTGDSRGVFATSSSGYGVYGTSNTGTGVFGQTFGEGVNGVYGLANNSGGSAVYGQNDGTGYGVAGRAAGGTGVLADSANGTALQVTGRTKFSTAGTAMIASGQKKVTVTLAGVTATDFVLATVQGSGAFFVKNASAGSGSSRSSSNKAPTAPATVKVAYFVISAS
jgi:hypothetical protein